MLEELEQSELGTQEYWENRYKSDINNYRSHGDIGDVWFGEDIVDRLIKWMNKSTLVNKSHFILDIGCGNGMFLTELFNEGYTNLLGVDYSEHAIVLAREISQKYNANIEFKIDNILKTNLPQRSFDIIFDKGTYDAVSLSENPKDDRNTYINNASSCLKENGLVIVTSCNWTDEELKQQFDNKFSLHEIIPTPQYKFGGKVGNVVSSVVFGKK